MLKLLKHFIAQGVHLVYLTARPAFMEKISTNRLLELGFPKGEYIFNDSDLGVSDYKVEKVRNFEVRNPQSHTIGFLDDKRITISKLRKINPELPILQVLYDFANEEGSKLRTYFLDSDLRIYEVFSRGGRFNSELSGQSCKAILQSSNHD